jgi:N-acetylglucosamine-6-phosphate deacetylase
MSRHSFSSPIIVDLHLNGITIPKSELSGAQHVVNFSAHYLTLEDVRHATAELLAHGTTHFLATLVSGPEEITLRNLGILADAMEQPWGKPIIGIHAEGPFFSKETRGAHCEKDIRDCADISLFKNMFDASKGKLVLATISPAIKDAAPFIEKIASMGVVVSLGHHNANMSQIKEALDAGATGITHAPNGWSKEPREDGLKNLEVVLQLTDPRTFVMFIPDGVHVSKDFLQIWHRVIEAVKPGHSVFVSDASPLSGAEEGKYSFCNQSIVVKHDDLGHLRTFPLTGSYLQLPECMNILRGMDIINENDIVDGVSRNPLTFMEKALERIDRFPDLSELK